MKLERIKLADFHAPKRLARLVHLQLGNAGLRVDVEGIAMALDIEHLRLGEFDGFEGMLLTDAFRSRGVILANARHGQRRARFTIAHELGHFLMERHVLTDASGFRCRSQDMRETREGRQDLKQESQANQFGIELLAPSRKFESRLSNDPDLKDAERARDTFDISLEASVRRLVDLRPETLAAVWSQNGRIRYYHKGPNFPWINRQPGSAIVSTTPAFRAVSNGELGLTGITEAHPMTWTDAPDLELWEQTRVGRDGHAVTLLWAERPDDDEAETDEIEELGIPRFR